jgi:hypothetical protein
MSITPTRILIASVALASETPIIFFPNISQAYDDLELVLSSRAGTTSTGGGSVRAMLNTVTGYSQRTVYGAGTSGTFGSQGSTDAFMRVGSSVNPSDATGFSVDRAFIFNYSSTTANTKVSFARTAQPNRGSSVAAFHLDAVSTCTQAGPVTSITLQRDGYGFFAAGTRINLYGIGR